MAKLIILPPYFGEFDMRLPVVLAVSGPRGKEVLYDALYGYLSNYVKVVAVFTDNPRRPRNGSVRFWQYPCFDSFRESVVQLVQDYKDGPQPLLFVDPMRAEDIQFTHDKIVQRDGGL